MGFTDLFKKQDINEGAALARSTPGAVLLDVRSTDEFREGHIPGSINVPGEQIRGIRQFVPDVETPIFAYCLSDMRSSRAVSALKTMGYKNVTNIGGIQGYSGELSVEE
jgi:rhodanese-related sulfurtransferase